MPPYPPSCFIGMHVINCWAVPAQPCIIFSTPGIFLLWPRYCLPVRRNSSLLVHKRDRSLNKYFYWKTGRDRKYRPYTISDDNDSKTKVRRFDDAHNFRVDHFSIWGHLDYLSGTSSVSLGSELIHSDIRVFCPIGPFHSDVRVFHSEDNLSLGWLYFHSEGNLLLDRQVFIPTVISLLRW